MREQTGKLIDKGADVIGQGTGDLIGVEDCTGFGDGCHNGFETKGG